MLKKLIIAVFVLSFIFALSGTALSDTGNRLNTYERVQPVNSINGAEKCVSTNEVPDNFNVTLQAIPVGTETLFEPVGDKGADTTGCELQDWCQYTGGYHETDWYGDDETMMSERFDVTPNHVVTVEGAAVRIYDVSDNAGGCDLIIKVWDDAGGAPNNVLATFTIDKADMVALGPGSWLFSFPSGVDVGYGPNYHISVGVSGDPSDYLGFGIYEENPPVYHGRSMYGYEDPPGTLNWVGLDVAFGTAMNVRIASYACQSYSVCYVQEPISGGHVMPMPNGYGDGINGMGQRFMSETAETLNTIYIWLYDHPSLPPYAGTNETNTLDFMVVADDGTGAPDPGTVYASGNIGPGYSTVYPSGPGWNLHAFDVSSLNLVFTGYFHVLCKVTSNDDADGNIGVIFLGADDDANAIGGSICWVDDATYGCWNRLIDDPHWTTYWYGDYDGAIDLAMVLCKDEFSVCRWNVLYSDLYLGGSNPLFVAQKVTGVNINRIDEVWTVVTNNGWWPVAAPDAPLFFNIYDDNSGLPGNLIYSTPVTRPTPADAAGWVNLVIPDVVVVGDFHVGFSWDNSVSGELAIIPFDNTTTDYNGGAFYSSDGTTWSSMTAAQAGNGWLSSNEIVEVHSCSVPFPERTCTDDDPLTTEDWPVHQHDQQRSGASLFSLGADINCDLDLNGYYLDPSWGASSVGPVVKDGIVACTFNDGDNSVVKIFDLYDITTPLATLGTYSQSNSVPSFFDIGGTTYLFLTGGTDTWIECYDMTNPASPSQVWSINSGNSFLGHPLTEFDGTTYTNFVLLNDGTDDVLFFTTNNAKVLAAYADDGTPYAGWSGVGNVVDLGGFAQVVYRGLTTDGTGTLFIGKQDPVGAEIRALDAFTGADVWQLAGTDLQGDDIYGVSVLEGFEAAIAYDVGTIWAMSTCVGDYPVDAVLYKINAGSGAVELSRDANYMRYSSTPVIDQNFVYCQTYTRWYHPPVDLGAVYAVTKTTLGIPWRKAWGENGVTTDERFLNDMLLSCEPEGVPDYLILFSENGYLHFIDTEGHEFFNRRIDFGDTYGYNIGDGGAIAEDTADVAHVIFQGWLGGVFDLTRSGVDRPRLQVNDFSKTTGVGFGTGTVPVVFDDLFTNTGCADLTLTYDIDDASNGSTPGISITAVGPGLQQQATKIAMEMNPNLSKFGETAVKEQITSEAKPVIDMTKKVNSAALAAPSFIAVDNYVFAPIPAGASVPCTVWVDQNYLTRGIQTAYMTLTSNDPDYFMNSTYLPATKPEIIVNIIGGCLLDSTYLHFGYNQNNTIIVSNTGRFGNSEWGDEAGFNLWDIDTVGAAYYCGAHIYGVSKYRLAMNSQDWLNATTPLDGEDAIYASMQADPNYIDADCKPATTLGVSMGNITFDGITNVALSGNQVHTSILDSVQNWDPGTGWAWDNVTNFFGPFDDTLTMGLKANVLTFAVYSNRTELDGNLHNTVFKVWEFKERNGRNVNDWYMGMYNDNDQEYLQSASGQASNYDADYSLAWTYNIGGNISTGVVKIPYGCGYDPCINAHNFWGDQTAGTGMIGYGYWDSAYSYMSNYVGVDNEAVISGADGESHYTFIQHDFTPNETFRFATANFQRGGGVDASYTNNSTSGQLKQLASWANKFMGFGRGDVNDDNVIDLTDIVYLINNVYNGGPNPVPFVYLGNLNAVSAGAGRDIDDIMWLIDYYFTGGPCPEGLWKHVNPIWDGDEL